MMNPTATVRDFTLGQFRRTHARRAAQTDSEAQTATDVFTDLSDGILALDFALTFADFDGAARQFALSVIGLIGDSDEPIAFYDEELAAHLNVSVRSVRRWRVAYMKAWQTKNFEFISITEGEYDSEKKRYERTRYGLPEEIREFVNTVTTEARQSSAYARDRRAAIEAAAKANYDDIPNAPARRRKRKPSRSEAVKVESYFNNAAKNLLKGRDTLGGMPDGTRAAYLSGAEGEELRDKLLDMQAQIAAILGDFPETIETAEVSYIPAKLAGIPPPPVRYPLKRPVLRRLVAA